MDLLSSAFVVLFIKIGKVDSNIVIFRMIPSDFFLLMFLPTLQDPLIRLSEHGRSPSKGTRYLLLYIRLNHILERLDNHLPVNA
jgi:hypothetical protein